MALSPRQLRLHSIEIQNDTTFIYHYETGSYLKRFLEDQPLWVRYEGSVRKIPPSIAAIPFLGWAFPWAGFLGCAIDIPVLDRQYTESLQSIGELFQSFYPGFHFPGRLNIGEKTLTLQPANRRTALLFTGGIDSYATALAHREENPLLITIWGSEERIGQQNIWNRVYAERGAIAKRLGLQLTVISSNFQDILRHWAIETYFPVQLHRPWNLEIAFGSIFLGLAAPLTWREGIGTLYFSSTFTAGTHPLDGSHPELVKRIFWTGTNVVLDGMDTERQTKIEKISETLDLNFPGLKFLVCSAPRESGNCSLCERCSCTMAGLALAGIDPAGHGFAVSPDTPEKIRRAIEQGLWPMAFAVYWHQIKDRVPRCRNSAAKDWRDFFNWLDETDLKPFIRIWPAVRWIKAKRFIKKMLPFEVLHWLITAKLHLKKQRR